jgi:hypothetical protein
MTLSNCLANNVLEAHWSRYGHLADMDPEIQFYADPNPD